MKSMNYLAFITLFFLANSGYAQDIDLSSVKLYSVTEILKNAPQLDKSDVLVKIEGQIIERVNADTYWFQDTTGKIQVEIETYLFPGFQFEDKTKLTVIGEVDYDALEEEEEVEIEVEFIEFIK